MKKYSTHLKYFVQRKISMAFFYGYWVGAIVAVLILIFFLLYYILIFQQ